MKFVSSDLSLNFISGILKTIQYDQNHIFRKKIYFWRRSIFYITSWMRACLIIYPPPPFSVGNLSYSVIDGAPPGP